MRFRRILYLGYYLKKLDVPKFKLFLAYARRKTGKSKVILVKDVINSVLFYNISILEYFQFHFYNLSKEERSKWAGTGFMYEFQLKMNPRNERQILDDKTLFYKNYADFFVHNVADVKDLIHKPDLEKALLKNPSGKIVFKVADGKCGAQVEIRHCNEFDKGDIYNFMEEKKYDLVEEFIQQHSDLNRLSPSAVNTIRIYTQLNHNNEVNILGCRLRISVNSDVDNMAAGNLAAPVDEKTGLVTGPGVYSDITKPECDVHPVTNVPIIGFQIPWWDELIRMVKKAALLHPQNRSIGWDVVVTDQGPGLIEGNHDWCKLLWQLPVKKGLKHELDLYLKDYMQTIDARQPELKLH